MNQIRLQILKRRIQESN